MVSYLCLWPCSLKAFEQGLQDSRDSVVDWRIDKEQVVQKHMQWVFQAYQGARSREAQVVLEFSEAIRLSAITLIMDRATQILRYGGHPVVVRYFPIHAR